MNAVDQVSSPSRSLLVTKSLTVAASPEKAFRVFAEEIHTWWPLASHHIGKSDPQTLIFEPFVGGRCLERYGDKADDMLKGFDSPDGWTSILQKFGAKVSES